MDRRDFFKTIFATPLLAPLLFGSSASANDELFLITDSPENCLPLLLQELRHQDKSFGRSYAVSSSHPQKQALSRTLKANGWIKASPNQKADLTLSFRPLQQPTAPSFTLIRAGKILDIRKKELFSFWKEMNQNHPRSSCMTIATLQAKQRVRTLGTSVRIYHNGQRVEEAPLKKDRLQTFWADRGKVTVIIEQGKVFIPSSSCRHKICCSAPPISISGERIVCAPNHFLLEIRGPGTIDTIIG